MTLTATLELDSKDRWRHCHAVKETSRVRRETELRVRVSDPWITATAMLLNVPVVARDDARKI
jgi:hypothetical protein